MTRPAVDAFLSGVRRSPVSMVVAPAGSGKTAAAAAWVRAELRRGGRVAWVPALEARRHASALSAALSSGVAADDRSPDRPVIVIDDAHELAEGARALVRRHLEARPDSAHLLILSREELDLVPPELVGPGPSMVLTPAEAAALLKLHHPAATPAEVARVVDGTEGRAAAVILAGWLLSTGLREADDVFRDDGRPVVVRLMERAFRSCPEELREVLLSICHESEVDDEEATALSGDPRAGRMLARAADYGLLVTAYADESGDETDAQAEETTRWRVHPLLREFLVDRTEGWAPFRGDAVVADARAARHYAAAGDPARAARYATRAGDPELLGQMLVEVGVDLIMLGESALVDTALARMDLTGRGSTGPAADPELAALRGLLLRGRHRDADAKAAADLAWSLGAGTTDVSRSLRADLAVLGAWQARYGWRDPVEALAAARTVLHCRHGGDGPALHDLTDLPAMRAGSLLAELAALEVWTGDLASAADHIHAATTLAHVLDAPRFTAAVLSLRATVEMISGAYQTALATAEECLEVCDLWGLRDTARSRALLARGWARFHAFELDAAERDLALARLYGEDMADPFLLTYTRLLEACALTARGDATAAVRVLDAQGVVTAHPPGFVARHTAIIRLLGDAHLGDHGSIRAEAVRLTDSGWPLDAALASAIADGLDDRPDAGLAALRRVEDDLPAEGTLGAAASVTRVALLQLLGTPEALEAARAGVPDVLGRTGRHRLLWILSMGWLLSPDFGALLEPSARTGPHQEFARAALVAFDRGPVGEAAEHDLTDRELDVLRQVALGGSNADIAGALFITENTVKTHLAAVFRKLGVDRRSAAARVARERHLI
ncbi:MAG: LuxR C-terminal-related transcriptional regulator [Nocardioides sp.]